MLQGIEGKAVLLKKKIKSNIKRLVGRKKKPKRPNFSILCSKVVA